MVTFTICAPYRFKINYVDYKRTIAYTI